MSHWRCSLTLAEDTNCPDQCDQRHSKKVGSKSVAFGIKATLFDPYGNIAVTGSLFNNHLTHHASTSVGRTKVAVLTGLTKCR